ncbi:uroporphyrin-III C-methyltransferase [Bryocella elongata]|uniref:uroporphyrinogen-III C-methyltransferase n=1 Tax=Bryocella elongata TaxID=863522 RepID=A0A1H5T760_9BACT|nr:uroporphyrinogen-III C-methyltransferase [Bryocella elongata]SEF58682.1 uroporphyrin-III C-methyltransferase [Bryocella elongata]
MPTHSTQTAATPGNVYLVGAGPGAPDLLTVRALRLLESCDLVLHDDLVPDEVLALAGPQAEIVSVGKRCGKPRITQQGIHELMIEGARANRSVVRLKSGDPLVFGRAGEELAALREASVPFEIVPGVTAAFAAGAALGLPLTDRTSASKLIFATGHHASSKDPAPVFEGAIPQDATLILYMPGRDMERLAQELRDGGLPPDTPCCAISHAATPEQNYVSCRLHELEHLTPGTAPVLLLVGRAMEPMIAGPGNSLEADALLDEVIDRAATMLE